MVGSVSFDNYAFNVDRQRLIEVANMAYGSGRSEGAKGGEGNIGILNGQVVKFNTHWSERRGEVTDDMRASCNQLRKELVTIAYEMLNIVDKGPRNTLDDMSVHLMRRDAFESICKDLGVSTDGKTIEAKGLLDRKVVAKVISQLSGAINKNWNLFSNAENNADTLTSKGINTRFSAVQDRTEPQSVPTEVQTKRAYMNKEFFSPGAVNKQGLFDHVDTRLQGSETCKTIMKDLIAKSSVPVTTAFIDASVKFAQAVKPHLSAQLESLNMPGNTSYDLLSSISKLGVDIYRELSTNRAVSDISQALRGRGMTDALKLLCDLALAQQLDSTKLHTQLNETGKGHLEGLLPMLEAKTESITQKLGRLNEQNDTVDTMNRIIRTDFEIIEGEANRVENNAAISFVQQMLARLQVAD